MTRAAGAGMLLLVLTACDLAAGLDRFVPANAGSGGATGTGASGTGASSTGGSAGTAGGDCADHLVISEVRTRGDAGATDDFVEVFNPTSETVELAGWKLLSRAPTVSDTERQKWLGVGELLPPGGHLLVAGTGFDDGATPDRVLDPSTSFGDDVRILLRNPVGDLVDIVCVCGTGCAAGSWDGCTAGPIQNPNVTPAGDKLARDFSLVRNPECRDTDAADDFVEADSTAASLTSP